MVLGRGCWLADYRTLQLARLSMSCSELEREA
jgi:hypothetical protein